MWGLAFVTRWKAGAMVGTGVGAGVVEGMWVVLDCGGVVCIPVDCVGEGVVDGMLVEADGVVSVGVDAGLICVTSGVPYNSRKLSVALISTFAYLLRCMVKTTATKTAVVKSAISMAIVHFLHLNGHVSVLDSSGIVRWCRSKPLEHDEQVGWELVVC